MKLLPLHFGSLFFNARLFDTLPSSIPKRRQRTPIGAGSYWGWDHPRRDATTSVAAVLTGLE